MSTIVLLRQAPVIPALRLSVSAVVIFRILLMLAGVCDARCAQILYAAFPHVDERLV